MDNPEPSLCRHVHRELLRNALLDFTPSIPATACHQRNYSQTYSRCSDSSHAERHTRLCLIVRAVALQACATDAPPSLYHGGLLIHGESSVLGGLSGTALALW